MINQYICESNLTTLLSFLEQYILGSQTIGCVDDLTQQFIFHSDNRRIVALVHHEWAHSYGSYPVVCRGGVWVAAAVES